MSQETALWLDLRNICKAKETAQKRMQELTQEITVLEMMQHWACFETDIGVITIYKQ